MAQAVADDYKSSLDDLNFNSKPHINMLTMLAEDNIKHAPLIVQTIIDHINRVESELKLPGLYLVDSIIKNVGEAYLTHFSQHMISLFTSVFEKVEESTRSLLFKLRQTWNDILPNKVLYGLDLRVKKLDPAWPVTAKHPTTKSIHINPRFISGSPSEKESESEPQSSELINEEDKIKQQQGEVLKQLLAKKEQLRLLELKKLEIAMKKKKCDAVAGPSGLQNFKANAGRDPRMVKINKVPQTFSPQKVPTSDVQGKSAENSTVCVPKLANAGKLNKMAVSKATKEATKASEKNSASSSQMSLNKSVKGTAKNADQTPSLNKLQQEKEKINLKPKTDSTYSKVKNVDETRSLSDDRKSVPSHNKTNANMKFVKNTKETDKTPKVPLKRKLADFEKTKEVQIRETSVPVSIRPVTQLPKNNLSQARTQSGPGKSKTDQGYDKGVTLSREKVQNENEKSAPKTSKKEKVLTTGKKVTPNKVKDQSSLDKPPERKGNIDYIPTFNRNIRIPFKRKVEPVQENQPIEKKAKNEEVDKSDYGLQESPVLFGSEDQDQRRPPNEFSEGDPKGWAQYKETHPDEFKSPLPAIRGNMDGRMKSRKFIPHDSNENFYPPDRLGRVRGSRGRFPSRFFSGRRGHFMRGFRGRGHSSNIGSVMLDPQAILQQAEEKFRCGKISKGDYMELCLDLQKMLESDEYQRYKEHISRIQNVDSYGTKDKRDYKNPVNMLPEFGMRQNLPAQPLRVQGPMFPQPDVKMFKLDNKMREIHFVDDKAFVFLDNNQPRELTFRDEPKEVFVEGLPDPLTLGFDGKSVEFNLDGKRYVMRFGTPAREVYINNHPYEAQFGGPPFAAMLEEGRVYKIRLGGPPPQVIVGEKLHYDPFAKFHSRKDDSFLKLPEMDQKMSAEIQHEDPPINAALQDVDMRVKITPNSAANDMKDVDWRHMPPPADPRNDNPQRQVWNENPPSKSYENPPNKNYENPPNNSYENPPSKSYENPPNKSYENPPSKSYENPPSKSYENPPSKSYENPPSKSYENPPSKSYENPPSKSYENPPSKSYENPPSKSYENPPSKSYENPPSKGYENRQEIQPGLATDSASYCEREKIQIAPEWQPTSQPSSDIICPTYTWEAPHPSEYPARKLDEGPHSGLPAQPIGEWDDFHSYDKCEKPKWMHDEYGQESRVPPPPLPPEQSHLYGNPRESNQHFESHSNQFEEPRYLRPPMPYSRRPTYHDRRMRGRLRNVRFGPWPYPNPRQRNLEPRHIALNRGSLLRQPQPRVPNMPPQPLLPPPMFPSPDSISVEATSSSQRVSRMPVPTIKTEPNVTSDAVLETKPTAPVGIPAIDVESLLEKLVAAGIITSKPFEPPPSAEPEAPENAEESAKIEKDSAEEESIPELELKPECLRVPHPGVTFALYKGSQCASCGMRFKEMQSEQYSRHLDWHFRMNRREKDGAKKAFSQRWYYEIDEWIQFEEFEDFEERTPSYFELQAAADTEQVEPAELPVVPSVPASEVPTEACLVCSETFQLFWVEEEEEWHLRDAVRHDGEAYHPGCYEDHKKALKAEESANESAAKEIMMEKEMEIIKCDVTVVLESVLNEVCTIVEVCVKVEPEEPVDANENEVLDAVADVVEDLCAEVKSESESNILEGKPGEEEIIGLISESDMEAEDSAPKVESKMVVMQSGGITLKVKAESLQAHSPVATTSERETKNDTTMESEEEDFRPPTPDPRFQVMPVVSKGKELSGLCCIM